MRSATPSGSRIQTGTLISYSIRGGTGLGSTLRAVNVETDPVHLKSSHELVELVEAQSPGLLAIADGFARLDIDDQRQLELELPVYDALYAWAKQQVA